MQESNINIIEHIQFWPASNWYYTFSTWRTKTKFRAFSKTAQCSAPTFTPTSGFLRTS